MKKTAVITLILIFGISSFALAGGPGFRGGFGFGYGMVLGGNGLEGYPFGDDVWHPCMEWGKKGPDLTVSIDEAKKDFEKQLASLNDPELRLGEITEHDEYYEVEVLK